MNTCWVPFDLMESFVVDVFMAVDIECFTELAAFKKTTGNILRGLRASQKMPGAERIYTYQGGI